MADGVRQRRVDAAPNPRTPSLESKVERTRQLVEDNDEAPITLLDIIRLVAGLLALNFLLSYLITNSWTWGFNPWWIQPAAIRAYLRGPISLTDAELLAYTGANASLPLLLALNGTIYDVSAGRRIYGPGGMYAYFAGRDATRAFVTGCFREDAVADYRGAEWTYVPADVPRWEEVRDEELGVEARERRRASVEAAREEVRRTVDGWASMFRGETGKGYFEVGRVKRGKRWLEVQPLRPLCESAEKGRPKGGGAVDAGAQYRGG